MKISKKFLKVVCLISSVSALSYSTTASAATCVQLNADLKYNQTDSAKNGPIAMLQTYLQTSGLLNSAPNGHFGPATQAAVKAFQTSAGISSTGYVGPQTRAYLATKTCSTTTVTPTPTTTPVTTPTSAYNITSPITGQVLSIGSSTAIQWNTTPSNSFNIGLEQPGGAGAGFIALNQVGSISGNRYTWKVGQVYSSQTNAYQNVVPGTYRIRIQNVTNSSNATDQVSGWFTILAQQFGVSSVMPSSAYADDASSVVLFGTGFTSSSRVYFDTNNSNLQATTRYVSPDGNLLVITIPTSISVGAHTLFISDGQNSNPATLSFTVKSIN